MMMEKFIVTNNKETAEKLKQITHCVYQNDMYWVFVNNGKLYTFKSQNDIKFTNKLFF